jgi:hypothetical protein
MPRLPSRLLAAGLLATGLTAQAASAVEVQVRLLSPGDAAILQAGTMATLEWAPLADLDGEEKWAEWEAFLSLDGGATYPVRVTPHLDRDLRRVSFQVPGFPTRNARLLVRVGDERRETAYELPQRFAVVAAPGTAGRLDLSRTAWQRGEPARPGEPGVLAWVEGSRRGGELRESRAAEPARAVPGLSFPAAEATPAVVVSEAPPSGAPPVDTEIRSALQPPRAGATHRGRMERPAAADILLLTQRQNE